MALLVVLPTFRISCQKKQLLAMILNDITLSKTS